jgi:RCC1 and BTB domain-containing protein
MNEGLLAEELAYFQIEEGGGGTGIYTWGRGEYGQLGHGSRAGLFTPTQIASLVGKRVLQVSLGTSHSALLTVDREVFTWGYGGDGRLGHGDERDQLVPRCMATMKEEEIAQVVCGELHTAALTTDGAVFTWGLGKDGRLGHANRESHLRPQRVTSLRDYAVTAVACGGLHTAALTERGEVMWRRWWGLVVVVVAHLLQLCLCLCRCLCRCRCR